MSAATVTGAVAAPAALAHVTGWALHVPGPGSDAVGPDEAAALLGRKGLLGKEPATRLANSASVDGSPRQKSRTVSRY